MKTTVINARVTLELKDDVEQIKMNRGIPFSLKIPNDETVAAMKAARTEKGEVVTLEQLKGDLT